MTTPAGWHRGDAGLRAIKIALNICAEISDVIADRGYTMLSAESFRRALHLIGINVTMDYPHRVKKKVLVHRWQHRAKSNLTPHTETVVENCGTLLHQAVPETLQKINGAPYAMSDHDHSVRSTYDRRARLFRWSSHQNLDGGKIKFRCPFCSGRAKNPDLNEDTVKLPVSVELVEAPEGMSRCCHGYFTVTDVADLDNYQAVPYGTHAWAKSYGRRGLVENLNKVLQCDEGLGRSFLYAFGHDSHQLAAIMLSAAHNIDIAKEYQRDATPEELGDIELPAVVFEDLSLVWPLESLPVDEPLEPPPPKKD